VNGVERGDKQHVAEIIRKQLTEVKRARLAERAEESRMNLAKGAVKTGTVKDLMEDLDSVIQIGWNNNSGGVVKE
jgi:hypothetical protein